MKPVDNAQGFLPLIPEPPHDPTWWRLDGRVGWRAALMADGEPGVECSSLDKALRLAQPPGTGRLLTEESGSFGGLTHPAQVALSPNGDLFLLDWQSLELKRFDPCRWEFVVVPCFGGKGSGPRQLLNPHGLGIWNGNLLVCDTGNHRLSVFTLRGFLLRGHWAPTLEAGLANPWEPYGVAFDHGGQVFVTDGANGCIHRFCPDGRWQQPLPGFGKATHLAVDCRDRLVVMMEGDRKSVRVVDREGKTAFEPGRPHELAADFPPLPFPVDAQGNLHLTGYCFDPVGACDRPASSEVRGIFDRFGRPLSQAAPPGPVYSPEGRYLSEPLDSKLYRCEWHRLVLEGEIPPGAGIQVSTYTAETEQPLDQVVNLSPSEWGTNLTAAEMPQGEWDCMVRSPRGRFLWLHLKFKGNGNVTPVLKSIRVEYPRLSLRRSLPAVFGEDPVAADFTDRFLGIFDTTLRSVEQVIDSQGHFFDPLSTPAGRDPKTGLDFLTWLAGWIGLTLDRHWPEEKRRRFLKQAARLYHLRGTRTGLWRQLLFYLGMEPETRCCPGHTPRSRCGPEPVVCDHSPPLPCAWQPPPLILEHYQLRRWLFLGAGRLGDQAVLWGRRIVNRSQLNEGARLDDTQIITTQDPYRDPFHVYAHKFTIFVPASYGRSPQLRQGLQNLVQRERPTHTHFAITYVEPRCRIGYQSMIGFDTVIGTYPGGLRLPETQLGRGLLGRPLPEREGPALAVGRQARVSSTTTLS